MLPGILTQSLNSARKFIGAVSFYLKNLKSPKCRNLMSKTYVTINDELSFSVSDHNWENMLFLPLWNKVY